MLFPWPSNHLKTTPFPIYCNIVSSVTWLSSTYLYTTVHMHFNNNNLNTKDTQEFCWRENTDSTGPQIGSSIWVIGVESLSRWLSRTVRTLQIKALADKFKETVLWEQRVPDSWVSFVLRLLLLKCIWTVVYKYVEDSQVTDDTILQ